MLKTDFVPVAFDQWYQRQQKDAEGKFYRRIAGQGPRTDFDSTTQGFYIATAGGKLLAYNNNRGPERIRSILRSTLARFDSRKNPAKPIGDDAAVDRNLVHILPAGGAVVRVNAKVLGGYLASSDRFRQIHQQAISRDNLWMTAEEKTDLLVNKFPESLKRRIARFHLIDNTRGEPPMWRGEEIKSLDISLDSAGIVSGKVHLETADGKRGFIGDLRGEIQFVRNKLSQFDLVAKGEYWGQGRYTKGAPAGRFPIAVTFRLADGTDIADTVAPQGLKGWSRPYWNP